MTKPPLHMNAKPGRPTLRRTAYGWLILSGVAAVAVAVADPGYFVFAPRRPLLEGVAILGLVLAVAGLVFVAVASNRRGSELRQEVEKWRAVGNALPMACIAVDARGRGVYWNRHFDAMLPGESHAPLAAIKAAIKAAMKAAPAGAAAGEAEVEACVARLSEAADSGASGVEEAGWGGDGGRPAWVRIRVYPLAGELALRLWTIQDITTERQLQRSVTELQSRFDDFVALAPVGFYEADGGGAFTFLNRTLAGWLGLPVETDETAEQAGAPGLSDFLANDASDDDSDADSDADGLRADRLPETLERIGKAELQLAGRAADGTRGEAFPASVQQAPASVREGDDERLVRGVVVHRGPEVALERLLRTVEKRFHGFFAETPMGVALLDKDGAFVETNRAWRLAVASDAAAAKGEGDWAFIEARDRDKFDAWLGDAVATPGMHGPLGVRLVQPTPDAGAATATFFVTRIEGEAGVLDGLILQLHDAPQAPGAHFDQGQKMQAVGQLAGGIAHDFNNLLTAMIGFCDLLLSRHSAGDPSFNDIMQIKQNANRAANLVRQLLAFSRQQTMRPAVLNVTDVLAELSHLLRRLIGTGVQLDMVHGRELGLVRVDPGQFEQVIINLAVNARDAMAEGGKLTIETKPLSVAETQARDDEVVAPGDYLSLTVSDTGHGMSEDTIEHIFEPFFTTKDVGAGTGLGMATAYGIIKQTGGHIFVDSEIDRGTRFEILLPVVEGADEEMASATTVTADLTGTGTILLVEDEDAVRLFGARALREKGYTVLDAPGGLEALELLRDSAETIDLLVTDVMMPEMDGTTLVKEVRAILPDIPVICMSGYAEDTFRKDLGEAKDISFLPKPFSLAELAAKVKEAM